MQEDTEFNQFHLQKSLNPERPKTENTKKRESNWAKKIVGFEKKMAPLCTETRDWTLASWHREGGQMNEEEEEEEGTEKRNEYFEGGRRRIRKRWLFKPKSILRSH